MSWLVILILIAGCGQREEPTVTLPATIRQVKQIPVLDLLDQALRATTHISWDPVTLCVQGFVFDKETGEVVSADGCPKDEAERQEFLRRLEPYYVPTDAD
mgnify:FL=1